jgi:inner membrane protein
LDTLTHALSGALLARATAPAVARAGDLAPRQRIALGTVAAAFPDADIVFAWISPLSYLYNHRGITHSLLLMPLWAIVLGVLCAWLLRRDLTRWRACAGVIMLGIGVHILGDLITSYGTMVFAPLSNARYAWSTTFIIDLWFSGIIVAGLVASALLRRSRLPAVAAGCVLVAYVGFQYVLQQRAIEFGAQYARAAGVRDAEVSAQPRPVSPFNWMVVVREQDRYHYSLVSLSRSEPPVPSADPGFIERLGAAYMPLAQAAWQQATRYGDNAEDQKLAREAWQQPQFGFYRWFAEYPAFSRIERGNPSECVWFEDLRFLTPGRGRIPFRYAVCREAGAVWRVYQPSAGGAHVAMH